MLKYENIFQKYGIIPPKHIRIRDEQTIDEYSHCFPPELLLALCKDPLLISAFSLAFLNDGPNFKIADHQSFIKNFNLSFDLSLIHPDLFYKFKFRNSRTGSFFLFNDSISKVINKLTLEQKDKYLTHFDSGYTLKKLFSNNFEEDITNEFISYIGKSFSEEFKKIDVTEFYTDLYDFIIQEQNKISTSSPL